MASETSLKNCEIQDRTVWAHFVNIFIGLWLITFPFTVKTEHSALISSDVISGILIIFWSLRSLKLNRWLSPWMVAFVGIWLQLAPLIYWAKNPATYLNDSVMGVLVVVFSVMVPQSPKNVLDDGPEIPKGWSYNPSSWTQRIPIIFLGAFGWLIARYMSAYQLGYIDTIWDPVFGSGTSDVLMSDVSKAFPVSDAGLGAVAYILEALMGCQGGAKRWHQMPWSVVVFGMIVVPLGLVSITLIILQPLMVNAWCFWCLLVGFCMLLMISFTVDEVALIIQYLRTAKQQNRNMWDVFWNGGDILGGEADRRTPKISAGFTKTFASMAWGITLPWNLILMVALGAWMMAAPAVFSITGSAAKNLYFIGPFTVVVATVAFADVTRAFRFGAWVLGAWMLITMFLFSGNGLAGNLNSLFCIAALILLAIPKGKISESYASISSKN